MEEGRMLFDASAYMLFEASGDSESAYFDATIKQESDSSSSAAAAAEDDDAQSCSYISSCGSTVQLHEAVGGGDDFLEFDYCSGDDEEDDGEGSDEEDGVVDQFRRRRRSPNAAAEPTKPKGCEESNVMMMNEREGDRLFWEACLAS